MPKPPAARVEGAVDSGAVDVLLLELLGLVLLPLLPVGVGVGVNVKTKVEVKVVKEWPEPTPTPVEKEVERMREALVEFAAACVLLPDAAGELVPDPVVAEALPPVLEPAGEDEEVVGWKRR